MLLARVVSRVPVVRGRVVGDELSVDELSGDELSVDELSGDELSVGDLT